MHVQCPLSSMKLMNRQKLLLTSLVFVVAVTVWILYRLVTPIYDGESRVPVSLLELIVRPELYEDKEVVVFGILAEIGGSLYLATNEMSISFVDLPSLVLVEPIGELSNPQASPTLRDCLMQPVSIVGTFDRIGGTRSYLRAVEKISYRTSSGEVNPMVDCYVAQ